MSNKRRDLTVPVTLVMIALGFLISLQLQTHKNVSAAEQINQERLANMKVVIENAKKENESLQKQHQALINTLDEARKQETDPVKIEVLEQMLIMDGTQTVQGPGIQVLIDDRKQENKLVIPMRTDELIEIINILRYARAEAISLNGQRIVGNTAVVLSGTATILVNQVPIQRSDGIPYEINAIGDQETLFNYFTNLVAPVLKESGKSVSVAKKNLQLPSFKGTYKFEHATPIFVDED